MKFRRKIGLFLMIISFFLLVTNFNITGGVILEQNLWKNIANIFLIGTLVLSFIMLSERKTLDAIIIPTGSLEQDIERADRGLEERKRLSKKGYYLISGYNQSELPGNERQVYHIYKELRRKGVKPIQMGLEGKSHNTMENVVYSLKKMQERARKNGYEQPIKVGAVSYPGHLKRIEDFEKQAIRKGLIKEDEFEFEKIKTPETEEEIKYEKNPLRRLKHLYLLKTMGKKK